MYLFLCSEQVKSIHFFTFSVKSPNHSFLHLLHKKGAAFLRPLGIGIVQSIT